MRAWTLVGGAVCLVVVGATAALMDGRYPYGQWLTAAPLAALLAVGMLSTSWGLLWAVPLPAVAVLVGASYGAPADPLWTAVGAVTTGLAASALWPVGVSVARRMRPRRATASAAVLLGAALVLPAVAAAERRTIVRVDRPRPLEVDERAGTVHGVALGERREEVRRRLGPGVPRRGDDGTLQPDVLTGPSSGEAAAASVQYGPRFLVVYDAADRVVQLWTTDRRARTRAGPGVGDSMRLFAAAYGRRACSEGGIGSDWPIPFPECDVPPGRAEGPWLYVGGTYDRAGVPAAVLVLSTRDVYALG